MGIFLSLREIARLERKLLPFLHSAAEIQVLYEIGHLQELGQPATMKTLYTLGIASAATINRYVAKVKRHNVLTTSRSRDDKRLIVLVLNKQLISFYSRHSDAFRSERVRPEKS